MHKEGVSFVRRYCLLFKVDCAYSILGKSFDSLSKSKDDKEPLYDAKVDQTVTFAIVKSSTSKEAWDTLHTLYANKSHTKIFSLQNTLASVTKQSHSVAEYLRDIKNVVDELATAGAPMSDIELDVKILSGLGPEYDSISAVIQARDFPISYDDLYDKLITRELLRTHREHIKSSSPIIFILA
ncbi:hypothetical protein V6N12_045208 [Hibiscus sabdariffa]|uniref:UBN2 domain-containing protein n=1 Tax=Hibiscus sabdariffa TaxID=183260 RepID=A0ABR2G231_9ROSI